MALLIHNNFEFKNILSGGYVINEDVPEVLSTSTMADGSIRRNYGKMDKTNIKVQFGQLDKTLYLEYMAHFQNKEDIFTYYSPKTNTMQTRRFAITFPKISILSINKNFRYDEFEIELSQIGEA